MNKILHTYLTTVILTFLVLGNPSAAHSQNEILDSLKKEIKAAKDDTTKVNLFCELSKEQCLDLRLAEALKSGKMAEVLAKKIHYKRGLAKALHNIGNVFIQEGNYPDALEFHLQAMKLKEELGDLKGQAASYNNIAQIYNYTKNYKEAFANYDLSLKIKNQLLAKARSDHDEKEIKRIRLSIASSSNSIGTTLDEMGKHKEAIWYYSETIKIHEEYNNVKGIAACTENMGVAYFQLQNFEKALEQFLRTYELRSAKSDEQHLAGTFLNLGATYLKLNKLNEARKFFDRSLPLALELRQTEVSRDVYGGLFELEYKLGNYKQSLFYYKTTIRFRDSILNTNITKKMTKLQLIHAQKKKDAEAKLVQDKKDAIVQEKSKLQKIIILSICLVMFIVIGFAVYAAINFRQKQKINLEITKQKEIIEEKQKEILSSITYAKRIQTSLMTSENYIERVLDRLLNKQNP